MTNSKRIFFGPALALLVAGFGCAEAESEAVGSADDAIVGGVIDEGHGYVIGVGFSNGPFCTATLVSTRSVLTAAHCAENSPTHVHFGVSGNDAPGPIAIDQVVIHPEWNANHNTPDLALVRLVKPTGVQPVTLLRQQLNNSATFMGPDWTFVGYGVNSGYNKTGAGVKRVAAFPFKSLGPTVTSDGNPVAVPFIYYETKLQSGCYGDSGGPSFFVDGAVEKQGAVTSYGSPGCKYYGVYSRVDLPYLNDFVQPTIDMFEGNNPCKNDGVCNERCNTDQVLDPDCAENHCEADGVCAWACVNPVDPDCLALGVDHCLEDGVCDPSCTPADSDCGGGSLVSRSSSSSSSGGGTGGDADGGGGAGGALPSPPDEYLYKDMLSYDGGCSASGRTNESSYAWLLLGLVVRRPRRRQH